MMKSKKKDKKQATPIPEGIALDIENMAKDRKVKKEYEEGEKARKENMGKIFYKGGVVGYASGGMVQSRGNGMARGKKTRIC